MAFIKKVIQSFFGPPLLVLLSGLVLFGVGEFNAQDGQNFTYTSSSSTNPPTYDVGETVTIYYIQENPHEARIKGEGGVFRWIFIVAGTGAVTAGFVMFAQVLRDRLIAGE